MQALSLHMTGLDKVLELLALQESKARVELLKERS